MQYLLLHFGYAFLVLGLIIEGDATLVAAMILASQAGQPYFDPRWVIGIALGVTVGANELIYELGALGRMRVLVGNRKHYQRAAKWLHRSRAGYLALLFSRFMWGFRLMIPFAAGLLHIRRRRFSIPNLLGGVIWVSVLAYFGVALQSLFVLLHDDLLRYQSHIAVALFLLGLLIGLGTIPWRIMRRALRQEAEALHLAPRRGVATAAATPVSAGTATAEPRAHGAAETPPPRPSASAAHPALERRAAP